MENHFKTKNLGNSLNWLLSTYLKNTFSGFLGE